MPEARSTNACARHRDYPYVAQRSDASLERLATMIRACELADGTWLIMETWQLTLRTIMKTFADNGTDCVGTYPSHD